MYACRQGFAAPVPLSSGPPLMIRLPSSPPEKTSSTDEGQCSKTYAVDGPIGADEMLRQRGMSFVQWKPKLWFG